MFGTLDGLAFQEVSIHHFNSRPLTAVRLSILLCIWLAMLSRPIFRVVLFCLLFGTFIFMFLPPTGHPRLMGSPNFPAHHRPRPKGPSKLFPPQPGSHRHRTKPQRPLSRPDDHRMGDVWEQRADAVRGAFLQAYNSYLAQAAPHDELLPLTKGPTDKCVLFESRPRAPLTSWRFRGLLRAASMAGASRI